MSIEAEVVPAVDQQARERAPKLTDNIIQHGVYEAPKTMGLSAAEAYKTMRREASGRALLNANWFKSNQPRTPIITITAIRYIRGSNNYKHTNGQ